MYLFFKRITFYINLISPIKWHFTDIILHFFKTQSYIELCQSYDI